MPHARPGAEMNRHQLDGHLAIHNRGVVTLEQVLGECSLVVGFGKFWIGLEGLIEVFDGVLVVAAADRLGAAAYLMVRLARPAAKPYRPHRMLGQLIYHRIGIFKLPRERRQTRIATDERQRQRCNFSRIFTFAGENRDDLLGSPFRFDQAEQVRQIALFQRRLDDRHEFIRIDC